MKTARILSPVLIAATTYVGTAAASDNHADPAPSRHEQFVAAKRAALIAGTNVYDAQIQRHVSSLPQRFAALYGDLVKPEGDHLGVIVPVRFGDRTLILLPHPFKLGEDVLAIESKHGIFHRVSLGDIDATGGLTGAEFSVGDPLHNSELLNGLAARRGSPTHQQLLKKELPGEEPPLAEQLITTLARFVGEDAMHDVARLGELRWEAIHQRFASDTAENLVAVLFGIGFEQFLNQPYDRDGALRLDILFRRAGGRPHLSADNLPVEGRVDGTRIHIVPQGVTYAGTPDDESNPMLVQAQKIGPGPHQLKIPAPAITALQQSVTEILGAEPLPAEQTPFVSK